METIIKKIKEIANRKQFGRIVVEFTFQHGLIKKATIKESDEVIINNE